MFNVQKSLSKAALILAAVAVFGPAMSSAYSTIEPDADETPLSPNVKVRVFVHNPHPGKPQRTVAICTETVNDLISDYGSTGWYLGGPETYRMNESTVPAGLAVSSVYTALDASWATWKTADENIVAIKGAPTSISRARYDGINLVAWGKVSGNAIAVTYTWYSTVSGQMLESDTIFNSRLKWSSALYTTDCGGAAGAYDVQNIATHEFGHWVGLDDLYKTADQDLTMYGYGYTAELKKDTLGAGDSIGAAAMTP